MFPIVIGADNGNGCVLYTKPPSPKKDEDEFSIFRWLRRDKHWVPLAWTAGAAGACVVLGCLAALIYVCLQRRPEKVEKIDPQPLPPKKPLRSRVAPPPSSSESGAPAEWTLRTV